MTREEIGLQPRPKVILRHAQQDFDAISSGVFLLSIFCVPGKTFVIRVIHTKIVVSNLIQYKYLFKTIQHLFRRKFALRTR